MIGFCLGILRSLAAAVSAADGGDGVTLAPAAAVELSRAAVGAGSARALSLAPLDADPED